MRGDPDELVGRRAELAWLRQRMQLSVRGAPQCAFISGPTGIGKSRLALELITHAKAAGFLTLVGRGYDDVAVPFLPLREHIFPELAQLLDNGSGAPHALGIASGEDTDGFSESWEQAASTKLLLELTDLVFQAAARRPLLLFLDDLHWADSATLAVARHVVYRLAGGRQATPLLLVVAARPAPATEPLRREPRCAVVALAGLDPLEATDLARRRGATRVTRQWIWEQTKGNPLLIESIAHEVGSTGGADVRMPKDAQTAFRDLVQRLSPSCIDVLERAAILVPDLSIDALARLDRWDRETIVAAIDEACLAGVLADDATDLRFAHPLAQQCCLQRMGPIARARALADVARVLGPPDGPALMPVARHLVLAGSEADPDEVATLAAAAGRRSHDMCAWEEAAGFFEAAIATQDRRRVHATAAERATLHLAAGRCHQFALDSDGGRRHFERAAVLSHEARDVVGETQAQSERLMCLVSAGSVRGRDCEIVEALARQIETDAPDLAAEVLTIVSQAQWAAGKIPEARLTIDRTLALAVPRGLYSTAARACVSRAITNWFTVDLESALDDLYTADEYVRRGPDRMRRIGPSYRLPLTLLWLGRLDEARIAIDRATTLSNEVGSLWEYGLVLAARAGLALLSGDVTAADEDADRASRLQALSGYSWTTALLLPALALAHLNRGDIDGATEAVSTWEAGADDLSRSVYIALMRSVIAVRAGRAGREVLDLLPRLPIEPMLGAQDLAALVIDIARALDEPEVARPALALVEATIERGMIVSSSLAVMLTRIAGDGHALVGEVESARRRYKQAMQTADSAGALPEAALARLGLARIEATHDRAVAITMLRSTLPILEQLSLRPALAEAGALAQRLGVPTATSEVSNGQPISETTTLLFIDIVDSTRWAEELGDIDYRDRAQALERRLRLVMAEHRGTALSGINLGDGIVALFATPRDAVQAAFEAVRAAEGDVFRLHLGLHHGTILRDGNAMYGSAVNVAARICALSSSDEVLVTEELRRALGDDDERVAFIDRGIYVLKGVATPRRVYGALQSF